MIIDYQTITFWAGIGGIVFAVYNYFRNPQEAIDKRQAVSEKETDGKAALLAEQVKWEKEVTEKKFTAMQEDARNSMTLAQNHIHTVDTKVDVLTRQVGEIRGEIIRLTTILDERLPKKV